MKKFLLSCSVFLLSLFAIACTSCSDDQVEGIDYGDTYLSMEIYDADGDKLGTVSPSDVTATFTVGITYTLTFHLHPGNASFTASALSFEYDSDLISIETTEDANNSSNTHDYRFVGLAETDGTRMYAYLSVAELDMTFTIIADE